MEKIPRATMTTQLRGQFTSAALPLRNESLSGPISSTAGPCVTLSQHQICKRQAETNADPIVPSISGLFVNILVRKDPVNSILKPNEMTETTSSFQEERERKINSRSVLPAGKKRQERAEESNKKEKELYSKPE